jgi:hypothetical protein
MEDYILEVRDIRKSYMHQKDLLLLWENILDVLSFLSGTWTEIVHMKGPKIFFQI